MNKLERALAQLQRAQETVTALLGTAKRFPEEFPIGTVLAFRHVFDGCKTEYGYVALRAANGWWYTTGRARLSWDELVEFIGDAPCSIAKTWEDI